MGLNDPETATSEGVALFEGKNLLEATQDELRHLRRTRIAMIFQDPMTSLNPVKSIGWQLEEAVLVHRNVTRKEARARALEMMKAVRIPHPERRIDDYPHQFSGGMRQRVMIAMALINDPDLLIADEPTTALDVTTQAQILDLMRKLQDEFGMAIIMVTHDLGVVAEMDGDVVVMYAGRVAEAGGVDEIFGRPQHPYTWGLLGSLPGLRRSGRSSRPDLGQPPSLLHPPRAGCRFHPRCSRMRWTCAVRTCRSACRCPESRRTSRRADLDAATKDREAAKVLAGTMGAAL